MAVIQIPKPPPNAFNKHRPISALLKNQIVHLQEAEFRLPARQQTNIYINRIRTEGEAAEYIRQVTARLHPESATGFGLGIAAMGETAVTRKKKRKTKSRSKKIRSKKKTAPKTKAVRNRKKKS
jgi:hypothetical protein